MTRAALVLRVLAVCVFHESRQILIHHTICGATHVCLIDVGVDARWA